MVDQKNGVPDGDTVSSIPLPSAQTDPPPDNFNPIFCFIYDGTERFSTVTLEAIESLLQKASNISVGIIIPPSINKEELEEKLKSKDMNKSYVHIHQGSLHFSNWNATQFKLDIASFSDQFDPVIWSDSDVQFMSDPTVFVRRFFATGKPMALLSDHVNLEEAFLNRWEGGREQCFVPQACYMVFRSTVIPTLFKLWETIWREWIEPTPFAQHNDPYPEFYNSAFCTEQYALAQALQKLIGFQTPSSPEFSSAIEVMNRTQIYLHRSLVEKPISHVELPDLSPTITASDSDPWSFVSGSNNDDEHYTDVQTSSDAALGTTPTRTQQNKQNRQLIFSRMHFSPMDASRRWDYARRPESQDSDTEISQLTSNKQQLHPTIQSPIKLTSRRPPSLQTKTTPQNSKSHFSSSMNTAISMALIDNAASPRDPALSPNYTDQGPFPAGMNGGTPIILSSHNFGTGHFISPNVISRTLPDTNIVGKSFRQVDPLESTPKRIVVRDEPNEGVPLVVYRDSLPEDCERTEELALSTRSGSYEYLNRPSTDDTSSDSAYSIINVPSSQTAQALAETGAGQHQIPIGRERKDTASLKGSRSIDSFELVQLSTGTPLALSKYKFSELQPAHGVDSGKNTPRRHRTRRSHTINTANEERKRWEKEAHLSVKESEWNGNMSVRIELPLFHQPNPPPKEEGRTDELLSRIGECYEGGRLKGKETNSEESSVRQRARTEIGGETPITRLRQGSMTGSRILPFITDVEKEELDRENRVGTGKQSNSSVESTQTTNALTSTPSPHLSPHSSLAPLPSHVSSHNVTAFNANPHLPPNPIHLHPHPLPHPLASTPQSSSHAFSQPLSHPSSKHTSVFQSPVSRLYSFFDSSQQTVFSSSRHSPGFSPRQTYLMNSIIPPLNAKPSHSTHSQQSTTVFDKSQKRKLPRERDDESPVSSASSHIDWAAGSMDPFDYFKARRIAASRNTKSPEMTVPSPSLGQSPRAKAPSLTLIPNRNTTSPHFMSYHTPQPPFHRKEVLPELHHPLVHSSISPQNASSQASSENTLAPSVPTTSTEIHFDKPNNVVLANTNTPARTSTSSADDTDDESSFDWGSRGGSGGLDSQDEFEEIKARLAKNKTETNKSAAPSLSSSIQPRTTFHQVIPSLTFEDSGMVGSIQEVLGIDRDRTRTGMKESVPVCLRRGPTAEFRLFKFSSPSELPPSLVSTHSPSQDMPGDLIMSQALWNNSPLSDDNHYEWVEVPQSETDDENETGQSEEQNTKSDNVSVNTDNHDTPQGLASQFPTPMPVPISLESSLEICRPTSDGKIVCEKKPKKAKPTKRRFVKQDRMIATTPIEHNGLPSNVSKQTGSQILSMIAEERDAIGSSNRPTPLVTPLIIPPPSSLTLPPQDPTPLKPHPPLIRELSKPSFVVYDYTAGGSPVVKDTSQNQNYNFTTPNTPDAPSQINLMSAMPHVSSQSSRSQTGSSGLPLTDHSTHHSSSRTDHSLNKSDSFTKQKKKATWTDDLSILLTASSPSESNEMSKKKSSSEQRKGKKKRKVSKDSDDKLHTSAVLAAHTGQYFPPANMTQDQFNAVLFNKRTGEPFSGPPQHDEEFVPIPFPSVPSHQSPPAVSFLISPTNLESRYDPPPLIPFTSNGSDASFAHSPQLVYNSSSNYGSPLPAPTQPEFIRRKDTEGSRSRADSSQMRTSQSPSGSESTYETDTDEASSPRPGSSTSDELSVPRYHSFHVSPDSILKPLESLALFDYNGKSPPEQPPLATASLFTDHPAPRPSGSHSPSHPSPKLLNRHQFMGIQNPIRSKSSLAHSSPAHPHSSNFSSASASTVSDTPSTVDSADGQAQPEQTQIRLQQREDDDSQFHKMMTPTQVVFIDNSLSSDPQHSPEASTNTLRNPSDYVMVDIIQDGSLMHFYNANLGETREFIRSNIHSINSFVTDPKK